MGTDRLEGIPTQALGAFRDGVCVHQAGRIVYANASLATLFRAESPTALIGESFYDLFAERERSALAELMDHGVGGADSPAARVWMGLPRDGGELALELTASSFVARGEPHVLCVLRDTSDKLRAESALRESEDKFAHVFRSSSVLMAVSRVRDGRLIEVNDAFVRTLGYEREELIGRTTLELQIFADPEQRDEAIRRLKRDGVLHDFEIQIRTKSGEIRQGSFSADFVLVSGEPGLVTVMVDTTERKRVEEAQRVLETRLLQSQKLESLGVLAGGVAHDFNNILVSVLGYAELGLLDLPPSSLVRRHFAEIQKAASHAADLCRQMLAYSGKGRFAVEAIDVNALVREMIQLLGISLSKKVVLKLDLYEGLPPVDADISQMRQVLMNLVINASEAIGDREGAVTVETRPRDCDREDLSSVWMDESLEPGRYVTLEVSDTGSGMDDETQARMFDPFFTTKFTGRGLGLAAVLGIVRGHRGAIKVYSEKGKGTSIKVLLPASAAPAGEAKRPCGILPDWRDHGTILLVDDEESVRTVGRRLLGKLGFLVHAAGDGAEAVDVFRRHSEGIACVICDLTMPGMDSEEILREIRQIKPEIPVFLSSGYSEQEVSQRFRGHGLAGFLHKPYDISTLADKLGKVMPLREPRRS